MPFNYQWKKANAIDSCFWDKDRCVTSLAFVSARLLQLEEDGNADHGDADEGVRDDEQDFSAKSLNDHCCEASASNLVYQYQSMDWFGLEYLNWCPGYNLDCSSQHGTHAWVDGTARTLQNCFFCRWNLFELWWWCCHLKNLLWIWNNIVDAGP